MRTRSRPRSSSLPASGPLRIRTGPDAGKELDLGRDLVRIGTALECELVLGDPSVDATHCELEPGERGYVLRDLGSPWGTFVDGLRVREVYLDRAARLTLGHTDVDFVPSAQRRAPEAPDRDR